MTDAVRLITERVRERVLQAGPAAPAAATVARDEVRRYSELALGGALPLLDDERATEAQVVAAVTGLGPLQAYLDDPAVEEIWVNAPHRVFVAREGRSELTPLVLTDGEVRTLVERMLQASGRRVDVSQPFVDASLADGSRLHVVIPDVTRDWSVNIRKFSSRIRDLQQLVALGSLSRQAAEFLRMSVLAGCNILVSGATQSGKTTLLGALMSAARRTDRIITVEETFELDLAARDVVALQCRQPSLEGHGEITLRRLIKEALRMRPDRIVVGEVREAEALDLLLALNAGLPGACSIHANNARDALNKLAMLPLLAGRNISADFIVPTVASCIDLVVFCELDRDGTRHVSEILSVSGVVNAGVIEASPLFRRSGADLVPTGGHPAKLAKYRASGFDPAMVLGRSEPW
ncbi:MAG: Flp pilus assembly complex ATPase component TadA [Microbacteriaceae bacterium]|nr:Flp pilus assembly complex ATPase component TadA [Microbacteriaceae bacterium]MCL2794202.1 Flp pilus assembly complex ATPase component TadA [Microbacteriaceae bacterium]